MYYCIGNKFIGDKIIYLTKNYNSHFILHGIRLLSYTYNYKLTRHAYALKEFFPGGARFNICWYMMMDVMNINETSRKRYDHLLLSIQNNLFNII